MPKMTMQGKELSAVELNWREVFYTNCGMVLGEPSARPSPRLSIPCRGSRGVLPQMIARCAGKIVAMGSAAALRGQKRTSTYSVARGAQLAWVQAVGVRSRRTASR
jgi:hypothetical protein